GEIQTAQMTRITNKNIDKPFRCDLCYKQFRLRHHLTQHKMTHTREKPFACEFCDYRAGRVHTLKNHIAVVHVNRTKQFTCSFCDYKSEDNFSLKIHIMAYHQDVAEASQQK
ncbi:unnamed protein product, partial [Owenia fusiformis]